MEIILKVISMLEVNNYLGIFITFANLYCRNTLHIKDNSVKLPDTVF